MEEPSGRQLRRAFGAIGELSAVEQLAEFPSRVAEQLRRVVPCHHSGYTAVELGTSHVNIVADPPESVFDGGPEAFARFAHQNPLLANVARTGDRRALRLSDFMTRRELHRTELYNYVYRWIPLEYQIGMPLPPGGPDLGRPAEVVGLSLVRVERDFTDAEKALLELMRPHLSHMLSRLHELALLRATEAAEDAGRWVLLVQRDGTLAWVSRSAADALELQVGERLPSALTQWLSSMRAPGATERRGRWSGTPEAIGSHGPRSGTPEAIGSRDASPWSAPLWLDATALQARVVRDAYPGMDAVHLRALRGRPTIAALESLGLRRRQAEVLQLALTGRTAPQIARVLKLSPRTVEKHMGAIYTRLGAANRTEAILIAARALDP